MDNQADDVDVTMAKLVEDIKSGLDQSAAMITDDIDMMLKISVAFSLARISRQLATMQQASAVMSDNSHKTVQALETMARKLEGLVYETREVGQREMNLRVSVTKD